MTVEENELYSYHRHGISMSVVSDSFLRRNYCNSRGYADISGGFPSDPVDRGDSCITIYPSASPGAHRNIIENNISEGNGDSSMEVEFGTGTFNKFYGKYL